ncbi:MAG TPA: 6-phosphogluconolactonase [Gemmatimonadales bacterium]|nr:6-phosphogluconolactonase [Gemmatimonadales bacterium]
MMLLTVVPDPEHVAHPAAEWLEAEIAASIRARGGCALGLAGGRTPEPVYRELAQAADIAWSRVSVFFSDERAVPPDHVESNYRMVRSALLARVPIPAASVHRMEAERADRDQAAREYERLLPAALDILVLGVGQDGHTASLFPGSPALHEQRRLVLPVVGTKSPADRMTITPPVIASAHRIAVIATGADKAAVVARALEGPIAPEEVPAQLARRGAWFLDRAAAGRLTAVRVGV